MKGLAKGQNSSFEDFCTFLFSMYCFEFNHHCTCIALKDKDHILFGRNSDFLVSLKKLYMNCLYHLDHAYAFNGNTTSFIEMEDGVNEYGLTIGITFIYPKITKPGLNAGMLVRYLLEKCQTTSEAISLLKKVPIASQQTLTMVDRWGDLAVVECNCQKIEIIRPTVHSNFVLATNQFHSLNMKQFNHDEIDDWKSEERYQGAYRKLIEAQGDYSFDLMKNILSGKYGFMCQYDRKDDADTVWSVIYDMKNNGIFRAEGNPRRSYYKKDTRFKFQM